MYENHIVKFLVRAPGDNWTECFTTELEAHQAAMAGNRISPGNWVFAEHVNRDITGPYAPISDAQ